MTHYSAVIIGGGFTGIAASRLLKDSNTPHLVVEKIDKLGSFLHQTWDAFRFGMTIADFQLPGMDLMKQFRPNHRLTRDEAIGVVEEYSKSLPIRLNTEVRDLSRDKDGLFHLDLGSEKITADYVIVCTGPHHAFKSPEWTQPIRHKTIPVVHYKNSKPFQNNDHVLVVGSGLSALTIASDLKEESKAVNGKALKVSIACGNDDAKVMGDNAHQFSKNPKAPHLVKLLPSNLAKQGIFNWGRVEATHGKEMEFTSKGMHYRLHSGFFHHIILATGFHYYFSLFKHFPEIGVENNLPKHDLCKTAVPNLFIAGVAHKGQKDRVVTITQGTQDAIRVVGYIADAIQNKHKPIRAKL